MSGTAHVAVVTGGSRGIGRAIVQELASSGMKVAFTYHSNRQAADTLCQEVKELGGETVGFQQDVTNFAGANAMLAEVKECFGPIDMLVNNAGITRDKPLALMQEDDWRAVIETNLYGTIHFARAVVFGFMRQKRGRIVNITSVSGQTGLPGQTNYAAFKAGIIRFTEHWRKRWRNTGVTVNAVSPGGTSTRICWQPCRPREEQMLAKIPMGRIGQPHGGG